MEHGGIVVRRVWQYNLEGELYMIKSILHSHHYASMDIEFPGEVHRRPVDKPYWTATPSENYQYIKSNVNDLTIIQLGLTFADQYGNLPTFGTQFQYIWEFNFRDFDRTIHPHDPRAIEFLESQGIDFLENKLKGIDTLYFFCILKKFNLISDFVDLYWLTFQGSYDFAYLIKILTRKPLPDQLEGFLSLVKIYFGNYVFDLKHMMRYCNGLYGGLNRVAELLGVERKVEGSHQAGADSLLTMQVFMKMRNKIWEEKKQIVWAKGVLYGLEVTTEITTHC